jgi:hypothetical protein
MARIKWTGANKAILYNEVALEVSKGVKLEDALIVVKDKHFPDTQTNAVRSQYYRIKKAMETDEVYLNLAGLNTTKIDFGKVTENAHAGEFKIIDPDTAIELLADLADFVTKAMDDKQEMEQLKKELVRLQEIETEYKEMMKIFAKARELVVGDNPKTSFKAEINGNLERIDRR